MYISHKSNILLNIADTEWDCRRQSKGMSKPEYWAWIATITSGDPPVVTYPSEDFTIIEIQDENVSMRLSELDSYISSTIEGTTYNIKVYKNKKNGSHFEGDDTEKDKRVLADKWVDIRLERNRKLAETDYLALSDQTLSNNMKNYRDALRDVPSDNSDPDNIDWPAKP